MPQRQRNRTIFPSLIRRVLLAWLVAVVLEYLLLPADARNLEGIQGLESGNLTRVFLVTAGTAGVLWLLSPWLPGKSLERWAVVAVYALGLTLSLVFSFRWSWLVLCLALLTLAVVYGKKGWDRSPVPLEKPEPASRSCLWVMVGLSLVWFLLVCFWTVGRVRSFSSPSYDMGIFSQMFYHMKESGAPLTTLERDGLLSHFRVHMSPVYYLMLPFYCLVPRPETLQVLQAAVLVSAVIPLWLLGGLHGFRGWRRVAVCSLLLLYPAFSGGTGYDIHENCFLTPLILWFLYGMERRSAPLAFGAGLLTLLVKEDAAVYVAVAALWLLLQSLLRPGNRRRWDRIVAVSLLVLSVGWFLLVTGFLRNHGDGVMTYRYENLMYGNSRSLLTVVTSVMLHPMKALYECVDPEKLVYIAQTLLPLLGLPLLTRRYERYILLIPYVLVNLLSDYTYQHHIFFQYGFGSTGFLLYLTLVNLRDWNGSRFRSVALGTALAVSVAFFGSLVVPKALSYPIRAIRYQAHYYSIRQLLSQIPGEASVAATTFYTTELSQRETLYDVRYCSREHLLSCEYVVLRPDAQGDYQPWGGYEKLIRLLESQGYSPEFQLPDVLVVYRKAPPGHAAP